MSMRARRMAAAIDVMTGELTRVRFGPGVEGPVAWLARAARPGAGVL